MHKWAAAPNSRVGRGPSEATSKAIVRGQLLYYYTCGCCVSHRLLMCRYRVRVAMIARTRHKLCLSLKSFNGRVTLDAAKQGDVFLRPFAIFSATAPQNRSTCSRIIVSSFPCPRFRREYATRGKRTCLERMPVHSTNVLLFVAMSIVTCSENFEF